MALTTDLVKYNVNNSNIHNLKKLKVILITVGHKLDDQFWEKAMLEQPTSATHTLRTLQGSTQATVSDGKKKDAMTVYRLYFHIYIYIHWCQND